MSDGAPTWRYGLAWTAVLSAALLPLVALSLFAAPQTDDFCYGAMLLRRGLPGLWVHYQSWSGRLVASVLIPLPSIIAQVFGADLFRVYSCFALAFVLGLAVLAYWLIGKLLPGVANPTRLLFAVALFAVLIANAPMTRHMVFWMPGAVTYTLPAFVMMALFVVLYRTLAEQRWISRTQWRWFVAGLLIGSLCNELTGPTTAWMVALSLAARWYLGFQKPYAAQHAVLIAAAITGTLVVYLAPGNAARAATLPDSADLADSLLWGSLHTVRFFAHLLMPGVIGWFVLLALVIERSATASLEPRRAVACVAFALLTPLGAAWMSFVAGFYGQGSQLPGRAQNLPFFLSVLGLSLALIAASATPYRARAIDWLSTHLPRHTTRTRLALVGLALLVLSPAAVAAMWQLRQAPDFRREARAQFESLANDPQPIAYVEQITTTPSLLFANPLKSDANTWPNTCLAKFFAKEAVLPKPHPDGD
jgi:hypothetical protein